MPARVLVSLLPGGFTKPRKRWKPQFVNFFSTKKLSSHLPSSDRANDQKRLLSRGDRLWQRGIGWIMGEVLFAGEEPQEGPPLVCDVVADHPAESGIASLQRVQDGPLRRRTVDFERDLTVDLYQSSQMIGKYDLDHLRFPSPPRPLGACVRASAKSRQCLYLHRNDPGKVMDDWGPAVAAVGRDVHLPAGSTKVDTTGIERVDGHRVP